jgi:hypothetical protein
MKFAPLFVFFFCLHSYAETIYLNVSYSNEGSAKEVNNVFHFEMEAIPEVICSVDDSRENFKFMFTLNYIKENFVGVLEMVSSNNSSSVASSISSGAENFFMNLSLMKNGMVETVTLSSRQRLDLINSLAINELPGIDYSQSQLIDLHKLNVVTVKDIRGKTTKLYISCMEEN